MIAAFAASAAVAAAVWLASDGSVASWARCAVRRAHARNVPRWRERPSLFGVRQALDRYVPAFLKGSMASVETGRARALRRERCLDELPELIDVVALGLSAGISFDASLDVYCARYDTMLSSLLNEAMKSWQFGMATRREALEGVARNLGVAPFSTFVETVTESLEFGAPLVKSLTEQSDAVRRSRRALVEERIEKAPVKMLIPTGTLVLPAMLLAILGPILSSLTQVSG